MRSLTARWTLALVAVCLVEAALVIAAVRIGTQRSFDRLVEEQAMTSFTEAVGRYYRVNGTLDGIDRAFRRGGREDAPPTLGPSEGERPRRRSERRRGRSARPDRFGLADAEGRVVLPAAPYQLGDRLRDDDGTERYPLLVDGDTLGTILRTAEAQVLGPAEQRYLQETQAALLWAVALALLVAVGLGFVLARASTRPIRALRTATEAMARGELAQTVTVDAADEVGQLAASFNAMSARLAEARQLRRRMTADIAHDLRTPLSVLTGYLEALGEGTLDPTPERIATMRTEAEHLERLVEDLRTLALADAGELALHPSRVEVAGLLARVVAAFTPEAKAGGVALGLDVEAGLPVLHADADRLVQVLGNLVANALRHTPPGGLVRLCAEGRADGVEIRVEDTGEGIPADVLPHVFERMVRGDPARGQDGGASGLGLAIARSLVTMHGGTITAANRPEGGAVLAIHLPHGDQSVPRDEFGT